MKLKTPEEESSSARQVDLVVMDLGRTLVKMDEAIMATVRRVAGELAIPEGYADPVYKVFGTSIGDTDHDVRQAVKCLHKIQAQHPHYLLDSFAGLGGIVSQ